MSTAYLDTSAAMKLLVEEPESAALLAELTSHQPRLVASWLLHTELRSASVRNPKIVDADAVSAVLDVVDLVDLIRADLVATGSHVPLRSNDAIHLAVAVRLGLDQFITYDQELATAARRAGLAVLAPHSGRYRPTRAT